MRAVSCVADDVISRCPGMQQVQGN